MPIWPAIGLLALLPGLQRVTTDLYLLPALPTLKAQLPASMAQSPLTLTALPVACGVGRWLGQRMDGTLPPLALGVWFWSLCVALAAWTRVQKFGEPAKA